MASRETPRMTNGGGSPGHGHGPKSTRPATSERPGQKPKKKGKKTGSK
jgi:hypothetical protein